MITEVPTGSLDQYIRMFAYFLGTLFCAYLGWGAEVQRVRHFFRALMVMLLVQWSTVLLRVIGREEFVPTVQSYALTVALVVTVFFLGRMVLAIGRRF